MKLYELSTERLREEKRRIEAELSKRHKADELIIKELARDYSADILKRALEYKTKNDPQISPCIRNKCHDPATCCGCEDYQRWIDEVNDLDLEEQNADND